MAKQGRPGISYEAFVDVWKELLKEGRAGTNQAHDLLGGNKSTIAKHRERYEQEKSAEKLSIIKNIELPKALNEAIAQIKIKELEEVNEEKERLKARVDEIFVMVVDAESRRHTAEIALEDAKFNFEAKKQTSEQQLAIAQSRIIDLQERETKLTQRIEELAEQCKEAQRDAAVAQKEVELLREQISAK